MPRAKGVIRIDSDSTHGWQVRVYRHGKTYSRLFSDRKCGGKEEAFQQAQTYRESLKAEVDAMPESEPKRRLIRHNKNNATGVLGVSRTFKRDRHGHRHEVYAVSWNPAPGEARGTSFSIRKYGEEPRARRVAAAIAKARPMTRTGELAEVVRKATGYRSGAGKDPATRSFQAVRIHVNGELDELVTGLTAAETLLREGGRLAVVSFHSLEDRIVKRFFRDAANAVPSGSRHLPETRPPTRPRFGQVSKPVRPSEAEIARNPRARSATLRAAVRTAEPPRNQPKEHAA